MKGKIQSEELWIIHYLHHKVWRALNTDEVAEPNAFAVDVAIAAFEKGGEWLDSLRDYLFSNRDYARNFNMAVCLNGNIHFGIVKI